MAMPVPDAGHPRSKLRESLGFIVLTAIVITALGTVATLNRERLARNEQAWLAARIRMVLTTLSYDNDPLADSITVTAPEFLGSPAPVPVYRARQNGKPVATVLLPVAMGYGGPIRLLVAIDHAGTVLGVQVLEHHETPGLGDAFAASDSTWLAAFIGKTLEPPAEALARWTVRKEGGDFDQFTGATVTPRAIVKAVASALEYQRANRELLYATPKG